MLEPVPVPAAAIRNRHIATPVPAICGYLIPAGMPACLQNQNSNTPPPSPTPPSHRPGELRQLHMLLKLLCIAPDEMPHNTSAVLSGLRRLHRAPSSVGSAGRISSPRRSGAVTGVCHRSRGRPAAQASGWRGRAAAQASKGRERTSTLEFEGKGRAGRRKRGDEGEG
jgi:hypothetical protein